jgi:hypothetical protein
MRLTGTSAPEQDGEGNRQPKNLPSISPELENRILGGSEYNFNSEFERTFEFENPGDTYHRHVANIKSINQAIRDAEKAYGHVKGMALEFHKEPVAKFWKVFWGKAQDACSKITGVMNYVSPAKREEYHKSLLVKFSDCSSKLDETIQQYDTDSVDRKVDELNDLKRKAGLEFNQYKEMRNALEGESRKPRPIEEAERIHEDLAAIRKKVTMAAEAVVRYNALAKSAECNVHLSNMMLHSWGAYKSKIDRGIAAIRALYDKQEVAA